MPAFSKIFIKKHTDIAKRVFFSEFIEPKPENTQLTVYSKSCK